MQIRGREIDLVKVVLAIVALIAGSSALWNWYHPKQVADSKPTVLQEAKQAEGIPKVGVVIKKPLIAYQRDKFINKVSVPEEVKNNPANEFTATADIKPSPYGGTAVVFTNMSTGKTGISYEAKKAPFFEFKNVKELSADYGITSKGKQQGVIGAKWTFLRTGIVQWHGRGEITTEPEAKVFIGFHAEF